VEINFSSSTQTISDKTLPTHTNLQNISIPSKNDDGKCAEKAL
jgi:hypothetical protein